MTPTGAASKTKRVFWGPEERKQILQEVARLFTTGQAPPDLTGKKLMVLAQKALPVDRQRGFSGSQGVSTVGYAWFYAGVDEIRKGIGPTPPVSEQPQTQPWKGQPGLEEEIKKPLPPLELEEAPIPFRLDPSPNLDQVPVGQLLAALVRALNLVPQPQDVDLLVQDIRDLKAKVAGLEAGLQYALGSGGKQEALKKAARMRVMVFTLQPGQQQQMLTRQDQFPWLEVDFCESGHVPKGVPPGTKKVVYMTKYGGHERLDIAEYHVGRNNVIKVAGGLSELTTTLKHLSNEYARSHGSNNLGA